MNKRKEIRRKKKEFERLIKEVGVENISRPDIVEKAAALEEAMYEYCESFRELARVKRVSMI